MRTALLALISACAFAGILRAQERITGDTLRPTAKADTAQFVMAKSPLGAVLRSAVIPGWGQFYNESYWKIPIVWGITGFLIYGIVTENNSYLVYRDRYAASITALNPSGDLRLKQYREFYRDNRDTYGWWFLVTYLVQIADAYVDAQLFDFDVSNATHASLRVAPTGKLSLLLRW